MVVFKRVEILQCNSIYKSYIGLLGTDFQRKGPNVNACDVQLGPLHTPSHLILRTVPILQMGKLEFMWIKKLEDVANELKRPF